MGYTPKKDIGNLIRGDRVERDVKQPDRSEYFKGSLYNSRRWKRFSVFYRKSNPFCVSCGKFADDVDHIIPIAEGGSPYDEKNLQSLCKSCHAKKSNRDKK